MNKLIPLSSRFETADLAINAIVEIMAKPGDSDVKLNKILETALDYQGKIMDIKVGGELDMPMPYIVIAKQTLEDNKEKANNFARYMYIFNHITKNQYVKSLLTHDLIEWCIMRIVAGYDDVDIFSYAEEVHSNLVELSMKEV